MMCDPLSLSLTDFSVLVTAEITHPKSLRGENAYENSIATETLKSRTLTELYNVSQEICAT